jgi:crotonobetaine/carnitine-CoA ligase
MTGGVTARQVLQQPRRLDPAAARSAPRKRAAPHLAGNLHELGVRQHDHVVLVLPTCPLALRVMFAANYLGAVYVPVNPALKGSSLEHVLHNAGARIAIVHYNVLARVLAAAPATLKAVVHSSDDAISINGDVALRGVSAITKPSAPPPAPPKPIQPFDTQSIIYTSGTTGRSKGVLSSYMHAFSCVGPDAWNCLTPNDRQLVQRFLGSNHIRQPRRVCRTMCG